MQSVVKRAIRMSDCADQAVQQLNAGCATGHQVEKSCATRERVETDIIIIIIINSRPRRACKARNLYN